MLFYIKYLFMIIYLNQFIHATFKITNHNNIPLHEWLVLKDFYKETHGDAWSYSSNLTYFQKWNFTNYQYNYPCQDNWYGIKCTCAIVDDKTKDTLITEDETYYSYYYFSYDDHNNLLDSCNIQEIILINMNLYGTIPNYIFNLTELTVLTLPRNNLYGSIPNPDHRTNLYKLSLSFNNLSGIIPSMYHHTQLKYIFLYQNQLTGLVPNFENLINLESLYLSANRLQGTS